MQCSACADDPVLETLASPGRQSPDFAERIGKERALISTVFHSIFILSCRRPVVMEGMILGLQIWHSESFTIGAPPMHFKNPFFGQGLLFLTRLGLDATMQKVEGKW